MHFICFRWFQSLWLCLIPSFSFRWFRSWRQHPVYFMWFFSWRLYQFVWWFQSLRLHPFILQCLVISVMATASCSFPPSLAYFSHHNHILYVLGDFSHDNHIPSILSDFGHCDCVSFPPSILGDFGYDDHIPSVLGDFSHCNYRSAFFTCIPTWLARLTFDWSEELIFIK